MARRRRHAPKQISTVLGPIEVVIANGQTSPAAYKGPFCGTHLLSLAQGIWRSEGGAGESHSR